METSTRQSPDFHDKAEANVLQTLESEIPVSLEILGQDIVARIDKGDKNKAKADEMYKSAGLQLIQARKRVPDFKAFLRDHCGGISRSRAYELMKIADGKSDEVESNNRARDRRRREKEASVREPRTRGRSAKKPEPIKSESEKALAEFKFAVDHWFSKMDEDAKREAVAYALTNGKVGVS